MKLGYNKASGNVHHPITQAHVVCLPSPEGKHTHTHRKTKQNKNTSQSTIVSPWKCRKAEAERALSEEERLS